MNAPLTELDMQFIEVATGVFAAAWQLPDTVAIAHVVAASLHGRLLERNGCKSVDEIVRAAEIADDAACVCGNETEPHLLSQHPRGYCAVPECACGPGCIHEGFVRREPFDDAAFFRAVAIEAMGGAKVERFDIVAAKCLFPKSHKYDRECVHTFSVPSIEQESL